VRVAWVLFASATLLLLGGLSFTWVILSAEGPLRLGSFVLDILFFVALFAFPSVGVLIATRQPRNAIGWILLGIGLIWEGSFVLDGYSIYGLETHPGTLPAANVMTVLGTGSWVPGIGLIGTFLILLFPDGHLPSPRWRRWGWFCALALVLAYAAVTLFPAALNPEDTGLRMQIQNPLGIEALKPIEEILLSSILLIPLAIIGCALALIQRFRRSHGRERLQLKWLTAAAGFAAFSYLIAMVVSLNSAWGGGSTPGWIGFIQNLSVFSFMVIPIAVGIAILRHRLYDIDVILNRTLVYGSLTAFLAIVYFALVVTLQWMVARGPQTPPLVVAASTLGVAALFRPARSRAQTIIDRRFNRQAYDASRTIETFSTQLREEVDLDSLTHHLVTVVTKTMQPTRVSLWIKPSS
jgi:hypothetical protein